MTSIAEKLMIQPHTTVWLSEPGRLPLLAPMPDGVREVEALAAASVAVVFAESAAEVREQLRAHEADLDKPGVFWVACPKGDSEALGAVAAEFGMRAGGQVVIDGHWSGLRFGAGRAGDGAFAGGGG